jgi:predicted restriction endonuclease
MAKGDKWTREQLLVAMNLYCKLPFGQFYSTKPIIKQVAAKLGRTPSSLAMKLCNFASLDPVQRARGVKGLEGASELDHQIWQEFHENWDALGTRSEELFQGLFAKDDKSEAEISTKGVEVKPVRILAPPSGPTERTSLVKVRRSQQFFRQTILNIYQHRCCVTGIAVPELLVASHILPWSKFPKERLNPQNGLCLSSIHDSAFDCGLITFDDGLRLTLSKELEKYFPNDALEKNFQAYRGKRILETEKLSEPNREFLDYHRASLFRK